MVRDAYLRITHHGRTVILIGAACAALRHCSASVGRSLRWAMVRVVLVRHGTTESNLRDARMAVSIARGDLKMFGQADVTVDRETAPEAMKALMAGIANSVVVPFLASTLTSVQCTAAQQGFAFAATPFMVRTFASSFCFLYIIAFGTSLTKAYRLRGYLTACRSFYTQHFDSQHTGSYLSNSRLL